MDTGTHLIYGLSIAGLAHVDPIIHGDPTAATAVLIGTLVGQQAPDFDQVFRLKGNATYIRNHRGLSHSIPAVIVWTLGITGLLTLFFHDLPLLHVGCWVLVAVAFHVFSDLFNTYGTQALRPFTSKWISWNIIHIFDPVIFTLHASGIILWAFQLFPPQNIFLVVFSLTFLYYLWRTAVHYKLENNLKYVDPTHQYGDEYTLIPTIYLNTWNVVKRTKQGDYVTGEWRKGKIDWVDTIKNIHHPAVEASKKNKNIQALLYFSSYTAKQLKHHAWGYEIHWFDVRYRHRNKYPFVGVVLLNHDLQIITSYVGWLNVEKLEKKISPFIQS